MAKSYTIFLDNELIGTTLFESADAPLGVVFGSITFSDEVIGYDFIKEYCEEKGVELANDDAEDKIISTRTIPGLTVMNNKGVEIKGEGNQVAGMDGDQYEIYLEGIPYPFYEEEFPQHVKKYQTGFE
ncbi:hypothetical protein BH11BAC7_BH11BAC7_00650 [soil metagenome]